MSTYSSNLLNEMLRHYSIIASDKAYLSPTKDQHGLSIGKTGWTLSFKTGDKFIDWGGENYQITTSQQAIATQG